MAAIAFLRRALLAAIVTAMPWTAWANSYVLIELEHSPVGINDSGQIAANGVGQSYLRGKVFWGGKWHNLPTRSQAVAMNGHADVAGTYVGGVHESKGGFWPRKGEPMLIDARVNVYGINDSQVVVGAVDHYDCFTWKPEGGLKRFGTERSYCTAHAINNKGVVTGGTESGVFLWKHGEFTEIGKLLHHTGRNQGLAINEKNHVVGYATETGSQSRDPFYWDGETMIELDPDGAGGWYTYPLAINNADQIVGYTSPDNVTTFEALRFENGQLIRLEDEVVNLNGWKLEKATSINDAGVIVGIGDRGGFMLIPQ